LASVLPWFKGLANARTSVVCDFDALTATATLRARSSAPVLVLGVWAPYELESVALFERPLLVNDEGTKVELKTWSKFDGTEQSPPRSGRLGAFAVAPSLQV
jgi:hypothetical protein